ncbi:MAG: hypothetical protein AAF702_26500 [Chloroflexota bacterium]
MCRRQILIFLLLLLGIMLTMSACGPRATGGATIMMAGDERVAVDLPVIVIDYDTEGIPSFGGTPLGQLIQIIGFDEGQLGRIQLTPETVTMMAHANIQHIQIDNSVDGLLILVNGQPIPSLVWNEESLVATAEVMEMFGYGINLLEQVLPTLQTIGIGAIIRFPVGADAEIIPTVVAGDESIASEVEVSQQRFVETVGTPPQIQIIVHYAQDGSWEVAGLNPDQWTQVLPAPWYALNLPPTLITDLTDSGVRRVGFATNEDGLFISVNDKTLPHIGWSHGELQHVLHLTDQLGLLEAAVGGIAHAEELVVLFEEWLPAVQMINLRLSVHFPPH